MIELLEKESFEIVGIIDPAFDKGSSYLDYLILGDDDWLLNQGPDSKVDGIIVTPDIPELREKISRQYQARGFRSLSVLGGEISTRADIGEGVIVQSLAHVSPGVTLGEGVKLNIGALVMHDSRIGAYSTIAPGAVVLGNVTLGPRCYLGANATVLPGVTIGSDVIIGAGAVVTKDIADGSTIAGVPAKELSSTL